MQFISLILLPAMFLATCLATCFVLFWRISKQSKNKGNLTDRYFEGRRLNMLLKGREVDISDDLGIVQFSGTIMIFHHNEYVDPKVGQLYTIVLDKPEPFSKLLVNYDQIDKFLQGRTIKASFDTSQLLRTIQLKS